MTPWVSIGLRNTPTEVLETSLQQNDKSRGAVMSVFDPLGLASPVLITGKCMLQDIWRSGIDWDETIEADAHKKWLKWVNDMRNRSEYLDAYRPATPRGLHVFVDAAKSRTLRPCIGV
ncbi:hypothetical protein EVAR_77952_1 [Eumeta japonica]|uniref:Uncharacterized protein n=1 Tax=Eumeta variegata TaxID=151549 RepID=A0A4C1XUS8_EUMVA|nr:hypothetical protein EVAR_77952_1 [Eumeta japonica]